MKYPIMHVPVAERKRVAATLYDAGCRRYDFDREQTIDNIYGWDHLLDYIYIDDRQIKAGGSFYTKTSGFTLVNSLSHMIRFAKRMPHV